MAVNFLSTDFNRSLWARSVSGMRTGWQQRNGGETTQGGCSTKSPMGRESQHPPGRGSREARAVAGGGGCGTGLFIAGAVDIVGTVRASRWL